jgi:two-component system, NtrC family, response regulator HydG
VNFRILIAEDEDITRKHLLYALTKEGYEAVGARNGREALSLIESEHFDVLITDIKMPEMDGIELLERVKERHHGIEVLIITGFGSIDSAVDAMKKGAYEYITKPFNLDELILKVRNIHERSSLKKENLAMRAFLGMDKGVSIVARSESMRKIVGVVEDLKDSDCNVFLTGETGVGKGLLARIIHATSRRRNMPFLSLNCATLSEDLLVRELFGYEKGAFEGALKGKQGLVEIADSGTLFCDEITEMTPRLQATLRKLLEEGEFFREGGTSPVKANVRLIAATQREVRELISRGMFAQDLYSRLAAMEIFVPPLRERREDIEPLALFFLKKHLQGTNKVIPGFTEDAAQVLREYSFPGNVRELENIVERAVILEKGDLITSSSLPRSIKIFRIETFPPGRVQTISEITRDYAERVLELAEGDKLKAAELLGISEISLWKILKGK